MRAALQWTASVHKAIDLIHRYPTRVTMLRYEHFIDHFIQSFSRILDFSGLDSQAYDYDLIRKPTSEPFLAGDYPSSTVNAVAPPRTSSTPIPDRPTSARGDEVDIIAFRQAQVSLPLFRGESQWNQMSASEKSELMAVPEFAGMLCIMGFCP